MVLEYGSPLLTVFAVLEPRHRQMEPRTLLYGRCTAIPVCRLALAEGRKKFFARKLTTLSTKWPTLVLRPKRKVPRFLGVDKGWPIGIFQVVLLKKGFSLNFAGFKAVVLSVVTLSHMLPSQDNDWCGRSLSVARNGWHLHQSMRFGHRED